VQRGAEVDAFSGATAATSDVAGATATLTFTGTAVSWIGNTTSGGAHIAVDAFDVTP
jgi:hypothetical protein